MCILVINICICVYMINLLSSPYLLVFDDDRVHDTQEQMMLMQVVLVELSHGERISQEFYVLCFISWFWK